MKTILYTAAALAIAGWIIHSAANTPLVTLSHSEWSKADYLEDGHAPLSYMLAVSCMKVEPETAGTCASLPKKYDITWSQ